MGANKEAWHISRMWTRRAAQGKEGSGLKDEASKVQVKRPFVVEGGRTIYQQEEGQEGSCLLRTGSEGNVTLQTTETDRTA